MEQKIICFVIALILYIIGIIQLEKYKKIKKRQKNSIKVYAKVVSSEYVGYYVRDGEQYNEYLVTLEYEFNNEIRQYKYRTSEFVNVPPSLYKSGEQGEILYVEKDTGNAMLTGNASFTFLKLCIALMSATASLIIGFIL